MRKKSLKEMIEEGILSVGEELKMNYSDMEFIGIVTAEGKIKTSVGTSSVSQAAADMMKLSGKSKRKQMVANGYEWWKNKMGVPLIDLRGEENKKDKKDKLKDLKKMVEDGIIKENEEIYFYYKNLEYSGRVTRDGKIKIQSGTTTLNKASLELIFLITKREKNTVNAYNWWKTWNGTKLAELRKI